MSAHVKLKLLIVCVCRVRSSSSLWRQDRGHGRRSVATVLVPVIFLDMLWEEFGVWSKESEMRSLVLDVCELMLS